MDNKTGKFILSLRQEKGLSQYQLAEMIPISRQAVSKWERGENIPDSYTMLKLSDIFNVTINELLLGERQLDNSVESLEKTTLNILDQSNKKTKKIKRMLLIFTIIITVLLLSFLSYYFITSYNSTKVYLIGADNNDVYMRSGVFITTKEKYYFKFGRLLSNKDITIDNIQFCYKKNGKEILIAEDKDIDNLNIGDNYGYSEKIKSSDINLIKSNSYLKIKYNTDKLMIIKLKYKRDFINNQLFKNKEKDWKNYKEITSVKKEIKEEEKEIVNEEPKEEKKIEENKKEETTKAKENSKKEEQRKVEEVKPVVKEVKEDVKQEVNQAPPVEEEVTIEKIIEKIKEKGTYSSEGYFYETIIDGNVITYMYEDKLNQIMFFDSIGDYWDYYESTGRYTCAEILDNDLCTKHIFEKAKEHLFN